MTSPLTLPRSRVCALLDAKFMVHTVCTFRAPPQSGKTSLMNIYADWSSNRGVSAIFLMTPIGEDPNVVRKCIVFIVPSLSTLSQHKWDPTLRCPQSDALKMPSREALRMLFAEAPSKLVIIDGTARMYPEETRARKVDWHSDFWAMLNEHLMRIPKTCDVRILLLAAYTVHSGLCSVFLLSVERCSPWTIPLTLSWHRRRCVYRTICSATERLRCCLTGGRMGQACHC